LNQEATMMQEYYQPRLSNLLMSHLLKNIRHPNRRGFLFDRMYLHHRLRLRQK
jgi:hypothetical protein